MDAAGALARIVGVALVVAAYHVLTVPRDEPRPLGASEAARVEDVRRRLERLEGAPRPSNASAAAVEALETRIRALEVAARRPAGGTASDEEGWSQADLAGLRDAMARLRLEERHARDEADVRALVTRAAPEAPAEARDATARRVLAFLDEIRDLYGRRDAGTPEERAAVRRTLAEARERLQRDLRTSWPASVVEAILAPLPGGAR